MQIPTGRITESRAVEQDLFTPDQTEQDRAEILPGLGVILQGRRPALLKGRDQFCPVHRLPGRPPDLGRLIHHPTGGDQFPPLVLG